MTVRRRDVGLVTFVCLLTACRQAGSPAAADAFVPPQDASAVVQLPPIIGFDGETTDGTQALSNLAEQVSEQRAALKRRPDLLSMRRALVDGLLAQVTYSGHYGALSDLDRLTMASPPDIEAGPDQWILRARYLAATHRFSEALALLTEPAITDQLEVATARRSIAIARGEMDAKSWGVYADTVATKSDFASLSELAIGYAALGEFVRADELYRSALASYTNVSPFAVAWIQFQRGVMWAESADRPDWARPLYEDAVRRLPGYVSANVHLAELELEAGQRDTAIQRLQAVVGTTDDPEPHGRLAEWLEKTDPVAAHKHRDAAVKGWEGLLKSEHLAFSDHAAEFYLAAGANPLRAYALAEDNLANRGAPRAWLLAISAATAAGKHSRACELAAQAPARALTANVLLRHRVTQTRAGCEIP